MTIAVDMGRKATKQKKQTNKTSLRTLISFTYELRPLGLLYRLYMNYAL